MRSRAQLLRFETKPFHRARKPPLARAPVASRLTEAFGRQRARGTRCAIAWKAPLRGVSRRVHASRIVQRIMARPPPMSRAWAAWKPRTTRARYASIRARRWRQNNTSIE
jgi:hypothetical protein